MKKGNEDNLKISARVLGPLDNNTFFITNTVTKETVLIDPSFSPEKIFSHIRENGYRITAVFLTHGHFDHIASASQIAETFSVPLIAGAKEKEVLENESLNLSGDSLFTATGAKPFTVKATHFVSAGDMLSFCGTSFFVLETPGHTVGSVSYYCPEAGAVFTGDALFRGSFGRTDFPTGSLAQTVQSLTRVLFPLPESVIVYPGHGESSTIGEERKENPIAKKYGYETHPSVSP